MNRPKILFYDIETAPILAHVWRLWDNNVGLNQIESDWHIMSWAAKWLDEKEVMYADQSKAKDISDDKKILKQMWKLLDEADIVVTQNGIDFDQKKLNARFIIHGFQPPSSYKHVDICKIARQKFGFTSNKLEYLSSVLCTKNKKLTKRKFAGFELWKECLDGNLKAWREMQKYNKLDVTTLEELYHKIIPWDARINFDHYHNRTDNVCTCGSKEFYRNGFVYTPVGKYQRYKCKECGSEVRSRSNEFSKEKRKSLKVKVK